MGRNKRRELITMPGKKELVNGKNHKINKKGACGQKLLVTTTRWKAKWNRILARRTKIAITLWPGDDGLAKKKKKAKKAKNVRGANGTCQQPRELNATTSLPLFRAMQPGFQWTTDVLGL